MPESGEKLQKVLARTGLGSRREMERWIDAGRVKVGGKRAKLGDRVDTTAEVSVDGKPLEVSGAQKTRVLLYHKPPGEVCSRNDPEGRRTVFDRLPKLRSGRWISIGRLDYNTSGLLLFTTDGELANGLMHPSSNIEREYMVRVKGAVTDDTLKVLQEGVMLEDGMARFTDIQDGGGEGTNHWYYVVIMEGRTREVRRLWESQECVVSRLKRTRYGNVFIPSKVKQGQWIELQPKEVKDLYHTGGLPPRPVETRTTGEEVVMARQLNKRRGSKSGEQGKKSRGGKPAGQTKKPRGPTRGSKRG